MAAKEQPKKMRPTLGLTGVTVNAMALIAPGAFLWITYQMQAAQAAPGGAGTTDARPFGDRGGMNPFSSATRAILTAHGDPTDPARRRADLRDA